MRVRIAAAKLQIGPTTGPTLMRSPRRSGRCTAWTRATTCRCASDATVRWTDHTARSASRRPFGVSAPSRPELRETATHRLLHPQRLTLSRRTTKRLQRVRQMRPDPPDRLLRVGHRLERLDPLIQRMRRIGHVQIRQPVCEQVRILDRLCISKRQRQHRPVSRVQPPHRIRRRLHRGHQIQRPRRVQPRDLPSISHASPPTGGGPTGGECCSLAVARIGTFPSRSRPPTSTSLVGKVAVVGGRAMVRACGRGQCRLWMRRRCGCSRRY
jgi:hypothetical protein